MVTAPSACGFCKHVHPAEKSADGTCGAPIEHYGEQIPCFCLGPCSCPDSKHDDEAECPCSPECTCGEYLNVYCPRHGDPAANSPV